MARQSDPLKKGLLGSYRLIMPVGVLLLCAVLGIVLFTTNQPGSSSKATPEVNRAELGSLPMLYSSPRNPEVLYYVAQGQGGDTDIYSIALSVTLSSTPLPPPIDIISNTGISEYWPVVSPDGTRLAYFDVQNSIRRLKVLVPGGAPVDLLSTNSGIDFVNDYQVDLGFAPLWSPDGQWLAFQAKQHPDKGAAIELFVASSTGQGVKKISRNGNRVVNVIWVSAAALAFAEIRGNGTAMLYHADVNSDAAPIQISDEISLPK